MEVFARFDPTAPRIKPRINIQKVLKPQGVTNKYPRTFLLCLHNFYMFQTLYEANMNRVELKRVC